MAVMNSRKRSYTICPMLCVALEDFASVRWAVANLFRRGWDIHYSVYNSSLKPPLDVSIWRVMWRFPAS